MTLSTKRLIDNMPIMSEQPKPRRAPSGAAHGFVDEVIQPRTTRPTLIRALKTLATKREKNPAKKHGNIPL